MSNKVRFDLQCLGLPFITSTIFLLVTIAGIQPAIATLGIRYEKLAIKIRKPLAQLDDLKFVSFERSPVLIADMQRMVNAEVGTTEFVYKGYVEIGSTPKSEGQRPDVETLITYYSDPRDQIPHTPEVCYRQGGAIVNSNISTNIEVPDQAGGTRRIGCRLLDMQQPGCRVALLYVFCCEGEFYDSRETTRLAIAMPGNRYTYFMKVETMVFMGAYDEFDSSVARSKRLMCEVVAALVRDHLPTNADLTD